MRKLLLILTGSLFLFSCRKSNDPMIDYCGEAISEFKNIHTYEGTISFCNAQPPLQSWIPAEANVTFIDSNTFQFHLIADSISFDTILLYDLDCILAEKVIPNISFNGQTINDIGYYSDGINWIHINFGYPNCLVNTAFDGKSK